MKVELTDEKIKILLQARQLINDHWDRRVSAESKSLESVKSSRTNSLAITDILKERDETISSSVLEYQSGLKELGFDSVDDFRQFNEDMCLEVIKASLPLVQVCDHCKGLPNPPVPPCTQTCGGKSIHSIWQDTDEQRDWIYRLILKSERQLMQDYPDEITELHLSGVKGERTKTMPSMQSFSGNTTNLNVTCPEGHGFVIEWQGIESRQGVDITWRF
jgi:hypothetical protein